MSIFSIARGTLLTFLLVLHWCAPNEAVVLLHLPQFLDMFQHLLSFDVDSTLGGDGGMMTGTGITSALSPAGLSTFSSTLAESLRLQNDEFFQRLNMVLASSSSIGDVAPATAAATDIGKTAFSSPIAAFIEFLDQNPDLKLSTNEFLAKRANEISGEWAATLQDKLQAFPTSSTAAGATSMNSATTFQNLLAPAQRLFVNLQQAAVAAGQRSGIDWTGSASAATAQIADRVGAETLTEFNKFLDANPKLRLSTSQFVADYMDSVVLPTYQEVVARVVEKSPLVNGVREFSSRSTSSVVGEAVSALTEKTAPIFDTITTAVYDTVAKPSVTAVREWQETILAEAAKTRTTGGSAAAGVGAPAFKLPTFQPLVISDTVAANSVAALGSAVGAVTETLKHIVVDGVPEAGSAVGRAGVSFGTQLAEKGTYFAQNTVNFVDNTGKEFSSIREGIVSVLSRKPGDVANAVVNTNSGEIVVSDIALNSQKLFQTFGKAVESATKWQFFSDPNHWENGYWERNFQNIQKFASELDSTEKVKSLLFDPSLTALEKAGARFDEQLNSAISNSALHSSISSISSNSRGGDGDGRGVLNFQVTEFTNQVNHALDTVKSKLMKVNLLFADPLSHLQSGFQTSSSGLLETAEKVGESVREQLGLLRQELVKDASTYVDDFILTNQDL